MKKVNSKKIKGFSLIETLIAVSILMIAIAGPLSLVQAGLFSSNHQKNQVTAMYLAQEALEYIKNIRDTNSYTQYGTEGTEVNWLTGPDGKLLTVTCVGPGGCYVDPHGHLSASGKTYIKQASDPDLKLNLVTYNNKGTSYTYDTNGDVNKPTTFVRKVIIKPIEGTSDEVLVSVTVSWMDNALSRSYTVSENMYNYEQADQE